MPNDIDAPFRQLLQLTSVRIWRVSRVQRSTICAVLAVARHPDRDIRVEAEVVLLAIVASRVGQRKVLLLLLAAALVAHSMCVC